MNSARSRRSVAEGQALPFHARLHLVMERAADFGAGLET
jgi:hypothetical protein